MDPNEAYLAVDAGIVDLLNARDLIRQLPSTDSLMGEEARAEIRKKIHDDIGLAIAKIRKVKIHEITS